MGDFVEPKVCLIDKLLKQDFVEVECTLKINGLRMKYTQEQRMDHFNKLRF